MDVLAIILACSLHPDDALVKTLVDAQSGGTVLFVGDLTTLTMNDSLRTAADALHFIDQIRRRGGRPAAGLLGIPIDWASRYGLREADLLDACINISVGTAALSEYSDRCTGKRWRRPRRARPETRRRSPDPRAQSTRACILGRFAADLGVTGEPATILKALAGKQDESASGTIDPPPERSGVFAPAPPSQTAPPGWVDASDHHPTASPSFPARASATPSVAPAARRSAPRGPGDDLVVLPGKLPAAAAAAATHLRPRSRPP